ncbi:MAG: cupin domain-containing protein [Proteobacteria bacterium]|nr:cupin domain-containing protein [Pseudomonadota bacterium]
MQVPPGQGGSAHTHEVEEAFFVLEGVLTVFMEDGRGNRVSTRLNRWEAISCPAGVLHGFENEGDVDSTCRPSSAPASRGPSATPTTRSTRKRRRGWPRASPRPDRRTGTPVAAATR